MYKESKHSMASTEASNEIKLTQAPKDTISETALTPPTVVTRTHQDFVNLFARIQDGELRNYISTGFPALDQALNGGLTAGLYTVMATPGAGKSTLCMSMIPYVTAAGYHVILVSLEMSRDQILTKVASRISYMTFGADRAYSYQDICNMSPDNQKVVDIITEAYREEASHTTIYTSDQISSMDDVVLHVERCCGVLDKPPLLIVDYLQLMASTDEGPNEKQAADCAVKTFRAMALKHQMPVVLISSVGRTSYGKELNIGSAKESGGIEYTSDVLLGLEPVKSNKDNNSQVERTVSLKIIKNRFGPTDMAIRLRMLPQYSVFCPDDAPYPGGATRPDNYIEL